MPNFAEKVEIAVDSLSANPPREVDENEFIDASRLVYDGVRDIRRAVLLNRVSFLSLRRWPGLVEGSWTSGARDPGLIPGPTHSRPSKPSTPLIILYKW